MYSGGKDLPGGVRKFSRAACAKKVIAPGKKIPLHAPVYSVYRNVYLYMCAMVKEYNYILYFKDICLTCTDRFM